VELCVKADAIGAAVVVSVVGAISGSGKGPLSPDTLILGTLDIDCEARKERPDLGYINALARIENSTRIICPELYLSAYEFYKYCRGQLGNEDDLTLPNWRPSITVMEVYADTNSLLSTALGKSFSIDSRVAQGLKRSSTRAELKRLVTSD